MRFGGLSRRAALQLALATGAAGIGAGAGAGDGGATVRASASGARQFTTLVPDDGDSLDNFGSAVALSGSTALVGAGGDEDPNGEFAGSAYVFELDDGSWSQQTKLVADDGDSFDGFGDSVALSSDGTTALIGADDDDDPNGNNAGSAYVFAQEGGTWSQRAKLFADDGDSLDSFANSVALSSDGVTALIGAVEDEDPNGLQAGSAYVFGPEGGTWDQRTKLLPDDGDAGDLFGSSVALSNDGATALVSASYDADPDQEGSAYVLEREGGTWSQRAKITLDEESRGRFGSSVALSGDGATAVIGTTTDEGPRPNERPPGSAYVFDREGDSWSRRTELVPDDGDRGDAFGEPVALSNSGNVALVGDKNDAGPDGTRVGSAYVFERTDGEWSQRRKLSPDGDGSVNSVFGSSVAVTDSTALVGDRRETVSDRTLGGAAYVFDLGGSQPVEASFTSSIPAVDSPRFNAPEAGDAIQFDAASSNAPGGGIDSYEWDFDSDGSFDTRGMNVTHVWNSVGQKSPTLRVTDLEGRTATATRSLTVGLPGRRRTRQLASQIDAASVHSDIESVTGEQFDGALELATSTIDALREAIVDGRVDRAVAEDAITRLRTVETVSRDLVRRVGPAADDFLARQLVRKAVEAAAALTVVAISLKVAAATTAGGAAVIVGGTVDALLDAASFVLGDWLAPDSGGDSSYRQQVDRDLTDGANDIVDDIRTGAIRGAGAIADEIDSLVDTAVETAADGLRAVIELDVGDSVAETLSGSGLRLLGSGDALYQSLTEINRAFDPTAVATGLDGGTREATDAVATGRSGLFGAIDTTSRFVSNLSGLSADFTNVSETVEDAVTGGISDLRALAELGGTLLTGVYNGLVGAVTATVGAAVGPPLVTFIKTIHGQIVQSAIQGEAVGFVSL